MTDAPSFRRLLALAAATRDVVPLAVAGALCLAMRAALNGSVQREGPPEPSRNFVA